MFTDIVGYTTIMNENEDKAANIRQRHRDVFQKEHENFQGEILQYFGDGTLSIFQSGVEAVECAIKMQQAFQEKDPVPLRIGIHLGDVVLNDNDVYGDGVNIASRIESLGVPGCILISDKLYYAVKSHEFISAQSLGYFEFKNIKDPIEVFALANDGIRVPGRAEMMGKLTERKKSIAVLPFLNMSNDAENEYFSDGVSEEILNALAKIEAIKVTARTSSFSFKGKNVDVREIARQLNVAHILEGSVRKTGNRVRITAQLVSGIDGYHYFSETYDRTLDDIFAVQDEIALKITNRLRTHLGEKQQEQKLVEVSTTNMEAYDLYLKGLYYFNQWGSEAATKAKPYFEKAVELQDDFALPHAKLGTVYYLLAEGGHLSWAEAYEKAMAHVTKTFELKPEIPDIYEPLIAFKYDFKWDWQGTLEAIKKGLKQFPNSLEIQHLYAAFLFLRAEHVPESIAIMKKVVALDPMSVRMNLYLGVHSFFGFEMELASSAFQKVLSVVPDHRCALEFLGWIAALDGNYEKALQYFEQLQPVSGFRLHQSTCLGWVNYKMGKKDNAHQYLKEMEKLEKESEWNTFYTIDLATLYTCFEDFDKAFIYLEKAISNRIGDMMMLDSFDVYFGALRPDPRFRKMLDLIGDVPSIDI